MANSFIDVPFKLRLFPLLLNENLSEANEYIYVCTNMFVCNAREVCDNNYKFMPLKHIDMFIFKSHAEYENNGNVTFRSVNSVHSGRCLESTNEPNSQVIVCVCAIQC